MNYSPPPPRQRPKRTGTPFTWRHWLIIAMSLAAAFLAPFLLVRLIDYLI